NTHYRARGQEGHLPVVRALLEKGAAVDERDSEGWTPLFVAALGGHLEVDFDLSDVARRTSNSLGIPLCI
ncbi:hypothetical protein T484DRAFT_1641956, partial [Baffinella frigidus]